MREHASQQRGEGRIERDPFCGHRGRGLAGIMRKEGKMPCGGGRFEEKGRRIELRVGMVEIG